MADREINIPMGPDRTGRISIPEVLPGAGSPADQTIAQPPIGSADLSGLDVSASVEEDPVDAWLSTPMDAVPADEPTASAEPGAAASDPVAGEAREGQSYVSGDILSGGQSAEASADGAPADAGGEAESDAAVEVKPLNDVAASLGALRDSIGQGRELKAREKDREELAGKIDADREELADRDDILANYAAIVSEQDGIIAQSTQQRDALKAQLAQAAAQTEETTEALSRMRDYHDVQLQPLETALGRAQASADQAKNDERSRKSELSAAESELRRAEKDGDATTERARLDVAQAAHEEAVSRSNAAKEDLDEAQRAFDDLKAQVEQAEAPLESALSDLEATSSELKDGIARLGDVISAASKRRQYCDSVYQYPAETEKLRQGVEADEEALDRLDAENDELRGRLAESKKKSFKAKALIVGVVVLVILVILLFWYLSAR